MNARRETHRARHVRLHQALDELLADYLCHHPHASLQTLDVPRLMVWAAAQARHPTDPPRHAARDHHNGAQFLHAASRWEHRCVLEASRDGLRCIVCANVPLRYRRRLGAVKKLG